MRKGPYPLSTHISLAAAALGDAASGDAHPLQQMLLGIRAYQMHEWTAPRRALETIWQEGEVRLLAAAALDTNADRPFVLLIPSMINRSYILDLMPGRSMMQCLEGHGMYPVLLDWGNSIADTGQADLSAVVLQRLIPAMRFLMQRSGRSIHAFGYCMGGTLLAAAASRLREGLQSATFLAAPWDFHAGSQTLLTRVRFWAPSAAGLMREKTHLPMEWVQTVFASLNPIQSVQKFSKFAAMDPHSEDAKTFIAVEDWLNDGIDLPAALGQEVIDTWFLRNMAANGEWILDGRRVRVEDIQCPALVITSPRDKLVEAPCALALAKEMPQAEIMQPDCGHIGMIAGQRAIEDVWQPMAAWMLKQ